MSNQTRSIREMALEIKADWKKVNYAAEPYLEAMLSINLITDNYFCDSASGIVARFLGSAGSWRGENAKRIKAELKKLI